MRDDEDALWVLEQEYVGPDGQTRTRRGFLARVGIEEYGPGRIRPHERTHPGPKEDRLQAHPRHAREPLPDLLALRRPRRRGANGARRRQGRRRGTRSPTRTAPSTACGGSPTRRRRATVSDALRDKELLIADGHHRYETARVHHDEGGAGHVLMCLVALQDPGLTVFPTHRLLTQLDDDRREALRDAVRRDFELTQVAADELEPSRQRRRPHRLPRRPSPPAADAHAARPGDRRRRAAGQARALPRARHRRARGADPQAGAGDERGRHLAPARARLRARHRPGPPARGSGEAEAAFFMGATPVARVRDVAATGESMPPKSTYFFPKVLTGMVFNPLD